MTTSPRHRKAPVGLTVGSVVAELLPLGTNPADLNPQDGTPDWSHPPLWAPDLFAVVATLAERSGFYAEPGIALSTTAAGRARKRRLAKLAEELGKNWAESSTWWPDDRVLGLWDHLLASKASAVCAGVGRGRLWKRAAMQLLAISDEACAGIGFLPNAEDDAKSLPKKIVYQEYVNGLSGAPHQRTLPYLPRSLCRGVSPDRACVLPKGLTPEIGCTLRSATHNLALLPGAGQVAAEWRLADWPTSRLGLPERNLHALGPFNLLVVPFPYVLPARAFCVGRSPDGPDVDGYFDLDMVWLPPGTPQRQAELVSEFLFQLIQSAQVEGGLVHAMVLPETCLPREVARMVADSLAAKVLHLELFVAGVIESPQRRPVHGERPYPRNAAFVARFDRGEWVDHYSQAKHHRWRLSGSQLETYQLGHVLEAGRNWWERIDLAERQIFFGLDARQAVVAALVCEDLARYDPVLPVLASIGPNLVIALLMDGPQLVGRWSARHASVLADDPGSAVLTVTSLGMVRRSRPPKGVTPRDCVALWTERGKSPRELDLASGAHGLLLALSAQPRKQKTLDIRRQRDSGGLIEYRLTGERTVTLVDASTQFPWLDTGRDTPNMTVAG
jgi:hypothetical protein